MRASQRRHKGKRGTAFSKERIALQKKQMQMRGSKGAGTGQNGRKRKKCTTPRAQQTQRTKTSPKRIGKNKQPVSSPYEAPCAARREAKERPFGTQSRLQKSIVLQTQKEAHRATIDHPAVLYTTPLQQAQQEVHSAAKISRWKKSAKLPDHKKRK